MSLVCKKCGYKQHDEKTIEEMKCRFPELEDHDIPYYCGACMDAATDDEYISMDQEMCRLNCPLGGEETNDCEGCSYSVDYHYKDGNCVRRGE